MASAPPEIGADRRVAATTRIHTRTLDDRPEKALVEITAGVVGSLVMIGLQPDKSVSRWLRCMARHMQPVIDAAVRGRPTFDAP